MPKVDNNVDISDTLPTTMYVDIDDTLPKILFLTWFLHNPAAARMCVFYGTVG